MYNYPKDLIKIYLKLIKEIRKKFNEIIMNYKKKNKTV